MSLDIGLLIEKEKGTVRLKEIHLSSEHKRSLARFQTAEEALVWLEEYMDEEGVWYEGLLVKGFKNG